MLVRDRKSRMYFTAYNFIDDFRKGELRNGFRLAEPVFQELLGMMADDKELAKEINHKSIVLLLDAIDKKEIESLLVMAEVFSDG